MALSVVCSLHKAQLKEVEVLSDDLQSQETDFKHTLVTSTTRSEDPSLYFSCGHLTGFLQVLEILENVLSNRRHI